MIKKKSTTGAIPKNNTKTKRFSVQPETIRMLLLVLAIVVSGVMLLGLKNGVQLALSHYPIQQIKIVGTLKNIDQTLLKTALSPYMTESFFTVNLKNVQETAESLTWIDGASAKKEWPNTLIVSLHERVPVANWQKNQFLSTKGEVFSAENVQPDANLPTFIGIESQAVFIAERYTNMQKILSEVGLSVKALELSDRVSWEAQLDNGIKLVIDEKNSLEKLRRFTKLFPLFTEQQKLQLSRVDLRYENGLAIKWKKSDGHTDAA